MKSQDPDVPTAFKQTLAIATISAVALWASFPPLNLWPLAWVATIGWCWLVAPTTWKTKRPYRLLYLVGLLHWLGVIHWIRLPHWSAYFGWLALAGYLAVYVPLFVGLSRVLVHRLRIPLCIACPIVWTGLEFVRGYMLTGFSMGLLAHTQTSWPMAIQVADIGGAHLVSFIMVLVSACIVQGGILPLVRPGNTKPPTDRAHASPTKHWPIALGALAFALTLLYGNSQLADKSRSDSPSVNVALIQGNLDTAFDETMDPQKGFEDYRKLTQRALAKEKDIDLIVWPESMQSVPWFEVTSQSVPKDPDFPGTQQEFESRLRYGKSHCRHEARWFARNFQASALIGMPSYVFGDHPLRRYNSALWLDASGNPVSRYDKMHPVMFGEYVPLGKIFPWLYRLTPMGNGLETGREPIAVKISPGNSPDDDRASVTFSPCICYENTVPHLVRKQVRKLSKNGTSADALITVTNDGWFWGSSQLDIHLACGVFRAVELRRPMLIAANTGFSAWIDKRGRILDRGPRHAEGWVVAKVSARTPADQPISFYEGFGDSLCGIPCGLVCLLAAAVGWPARRKKADSLV